MLGTDPPSAGQVASCPGKFLSCLALNLCTPRDSWACPTPSTFFPADGGDFFLLRLPLLPTLHCRLPPHPLQAPPSALPGPSPDWARGRSGLEAATLPARPPAPSLGGWGAGGVSAQMERVLPPSVPVGSTVGAPRAGLDGAAGTPRGSRCWRGRL